MGDGKRLHMLLDFGHALDCAQEIAASLGRQHISGIPRMTDREAASLRPKRCASTLSREHR